MATKAVSKRTGAVVQSMDVGQPAATLIVDAGTGTVTVEVQIDSTLNEWILSDTYSADGVYKVDAAGCNVRLTATGDAAFAFVE